jgi:hypothetical protein
MVMMSILTQPSLYAFFNPMTLLLSLYLCFWHTIDPGDIGDVYVGETNEAGQKHGRGKISFESGDSYEGEFVSDIICGHGTFIWGTDGATFTGEWKGKCMLSLSLCCYSLIMMIMMMMSILTSTSAISASCSFYSHTPPLPSLFPSFLHDAVSKTISASKVL